MESIAPCLISAIIKALAYSGEIGHVSAPNRPPCEKGSGSGAGMAIV